MADEDQVWPAGQWPGAIQYEPGPAANVPDPGFDVWKAWNADNMSDSGPDKDKATQDFISGKIDQEQLDIARHKRTSFAGTDSADAGDGSDD